VQLALRSRKAARQQGVSFEDFKANIKNGVITQQVVRDEVGRRLQMTQGKEQAYYDEQQTGVSRAEQVRLSEILVRHPPMPTTQSSPRRRPRPMTSPPR